MKKLIHLKNILKKMYQPRGTVPKKWSKMGNFHTNVWLFYMSTAHTHKTTSSTSPQGNMFVDEIEEVG